MHTANATTSGQLARPIPVRDRMEPEGGCLTIVYVGDDDAVMAAWILSDGLIITRLSSSLWRAARESDTIYCALAESYRLRHRQARCCLLP
jgi:hypothetical protein